MDVKQAASEVEGAIIAVKELEILIPQQENDISFLIGANSSPIIRGTPLSKLTLPPEIPVDFAFFPFKQET